MENKRSSPRILVEFDVTCRGEKPPYAEAFGKSFNISFAGIGVKTKKAFRPKDEVIITIQRSFWSRAITIKGQVVWQAEMPGHYESLAGIRFTEDSSIKLDSLINSI
jgi:Tfp pilus assembly protein PilZ